MGTNFFTNEKENTLLEKIEGVFKYKKVHFFDALVGYFRASGYFRIRKFIQQTPKIRILVGINVDKLTYQANQQGLLFNPNAEQSQEEFFNDIKRNIQEAKYDKEVEDGMYQFIEDIMTGRITMRIHPKQNIHAKIYIFREEEYHPHGYGSVITGSSNLTEAGLEKNFEFNVELRYDDDIQFATETFEKLWEESVEIDITHIEKIKNDSYLNTGFTPYEVYLKFLLEYFGKSIDFDPNSVSDLPTGYRKLSYQIDAVNDGYAKMMKHNGFFLSDVVGLGKTIVSALIAKKFFFSNGFPTHRSHILVIVPPAIKENWDETLTEFKLDNFKIITNGSLHKVKNPELYDLIIVDEAHKFRSDTASMYNELQKLCKTKTKHYDGSLHDKKVILVSATPLNNKPEDIANLVYLFQDSKDSTLEEGNLQRFFREHIDRYNKLKKQKDLTLIAVDIARLRFWLALVVDAESPQPLPNLDYKITCGNSLLSRYDLETPLDNVFVEYNKGKNDEEKLSLAKYKKLVSDYTNTSNHEKKDLFRKTIEEIKKTFKTELSKKEINKIIGVKKEIYDLEQPNLFGEELTKAQKSELKKLKAKLEKLES